MDKKETVFTKRDTIGYKPLSVKMHYLFFSTALPKDATKKMGAFGGV
jgi:hypothetical protein